MDQPWRIELLDCLRALRGDQVVARFRTQKAGALLAYLAYHRGHPHSREALIELHWPGNHPEAGRNRLSQALTSLRRQLEPPGVPAGAVIQASRTSVELNPLAFTTDVTAFETALKAARTAGTVTERIARLTEAAELYRGELLPGYYDDWILGPRQWLAERYVRALGELLSLAQEEGDLPRALDYARRLVNADPLEEESHHELIRLLAAAGQPAAALRQFRELERVLEEQLSATPDPTIQELARQIETTQLSRPRVELAPSRPAGGSDALASLSGGDAPPFDEPTSGAIPLDSPYYVFRSADAEFQAAIDRQDGLVLVKGARQTGKTSLLARGLDQARRAGASVVLTDFQLLNAPQLASVDTLLHTLAEWIAAQLELDVLPQEVWSASGGPSINFELYLRRQVLSQVTSPVVWGMDEADRLFSYHFAGEVFGLFRSWHNRRSLDPAGPWARLTLALTYAAEARLFIADLNQSPFNVGTRVALERFTLEQVADLNRRYRCPLRIAAEVSRFYEWVDGQPYLAHRGIQAMATLGLDLASLEPQLGSDTGIFSDHLQHMLISLIRDPDLCEAVRQVLRGHPCPTVESFYRLRSAGVLAGESAREARPRCPLYAAYLNQQLV